MFKFGLPKKATYFSSESITCAQMINEIYEFAMKIARLVGLGIFDENFSMMNWRTGPMIFVLITGSFLSVYDIYKFSDDNFRCIFCLLLCSGQLQSYIKLYSFAYKRHDFIELRQKADKFDENFKSQKSSKILEEKLMEATHVCAILSFLYFSSYILISSFPILFYFITGKRILHVGIELPLIDWEQSFVGYALNFAHQMIALSAFSCLCTMILIVEVILVTCSIHQFDVLEIMLDDLDELLVKNDNGENNSKIEQHLKRVYQTHQNLMSFLIKLESAFVPYYIVEMGALIFQKVLVLYALINVNLQNLIAISELVLNFLMMNP